MGAKKLRATVAPKSTVRNDGPAPYRTAVDAEVSTQGVKTLFVLTLDLTTRTGSLRQFEVDESEMRNGQTVREPNLKLES